MIHSEQTNKEKTLTWEDYRPLHVMPANIENGLRFMQEQKQWLDKAQARFGVPPEVVTALLGVETKYGIYTGNNVGGVMALQIHDFFLLIQHCKRPLPGFSVKFESATEAGLESTIDRNFVVWCQAEGNFVKYFLEGKPNDRPLSPC